MSFGFTSDECLFSCRMAESSSAVVGHRNVTCVLASTFMLCTILPVAEIMKVRAHFMTSIGYKRIKNRDLNKLVSYFLL